MILYKIGGEYYNRYQCDMTSWSVYNKRPLSVMCVSTIVNACNLRAYIKAMGHLPSTYTMIPKAGTQKETWYITFEKYSIVQWFLLWYTS